LSGLPIAFGQSSSNQRAPAQVPDTAQFLTVADFRAALQSQPEPNAFSLRYAQAVIMSGARVGFPWRMIASMKTHFC
jgi:hypothetical protein